MMPFRNVALGISGGVDSSVAALLLKKKGFNVIGVFMRNWDLPEETGFCKVDEDLADAKYVCSRLKIPFCEVNFVKEYWNDIFETLVSEYRNGLTPNPDILCNKFIKFKAFYNYAMNNLKVDAIATGHYARTSFGNFLENYQPGVNVKLLMAEDTFKDQTFFLSQIAQEPLRKTMFPLGDLTKGIVKKIAMESDLEKIAKKPESTGICFIGTREFSKFISEYIAPKPGKFIDIKTGKVVGTHDGIHIYTLGQRTRLQGLKEPLYVVKKIQNSSDILVVFGVNHPVLYSTMFLTSEPHWIAEAPDFSCLLQGKFRFQHTKRLVGCNVFKLKSENLFGTLSRPLRALTPGQFAVFYQDNVCLGSAKISDVGPSEFSLGNQLSKDYDEYANRVAHAVNNKS